MNAKVETRSKPGQDRSRATVQSIMDSSAKLITELGFDAVSMTDIAKLAKISKAALYRYFPNKQALLLAHAEHSFEVHREEMQVIMQQSKPAETVLRNSIQHYCQRHIDSPFLLRLRAAIHADPVLSELDLKDSRENAALLVSFFKEHYPALKPALIETRSLLAMELIDSLARLIARVPKREQKRLIEEFMELFFADLVA